MSIKDRERGFKESTNQLNRFFSRYTLIHFEKGSTILRADDTPQGVYMIRNGYVCMYSLPHTGNSLTLNIFKPSSFFPLTWAIADIGNSFFYDALTPVDIYRAPLDAFVRFV